MLSFFLNNTAAGINTLVSNTTGSNNTAFGQDALRNNTDGGNNTANGTFSLKSNTSGDNNTASGVNALSKNLTGDNNTASGRDALFSNTTGNGNTASGLGALFNNTTGGINTASGQNALRSNISGVSNTAIGVNALRDNKTGSSNTATGRNALEKNTTGFNNIALGFDAGRNVTTGNNNIYIGNSGVASDTTTIKIGAAGLQNKTFIAGISGVNSSAAAIPVLIDSNGQLGTVASSRRYKEEIRDMGEKSSGLMQLRPVTFRYTRAFSNGEQPLQPGLIAEEVAEVYPDLVVHDHEGEIETVQYYKLIPMLLNELQKQYIELNNQRSQIVELKDRLSILESEHTSKLAQFKASKQ